MAFLWRRVRRIYPPYLFALVLFTISRAAKAYLGVDNVPARSAIDWVQNLTLTQWLSMITHPQHWASENPTLFVAAFWSLNYEEQFYLVIAFCLLLVARKGVPILTSVIALTVFGLAFNIYHPGNWICGIFLEYWTHSLWVQCYFSSYANTQLGAHALCSSSLCLDLAYFS
jgi:peptidoglycan/LPS O-acetylase OafA/YrhL